MFETPVSYLKLKNKQTNEQEEEALIKSKSWVPLEERKSLGSCD